MAKRKASTSAVNARTQIGPRQTDRCLNGVRVHTPPGARGPVHGRHRSQPRSILLSDGQGTKEGFRQRALRWCIDVSQTFPGVFGQTRTLTSLTTHAREVCRQMIPPTVFSVSCCFLDWDEAVSVGIAKDPCAQLHSAPGSMMQHRSDV